MPSAFFRLSLGESPLPLPGLSAPRLFTAGLSTAWQGPFTLLSLIESNGKIAMVIIGLWVNHSFVDNGLVICEDLVL